MKIGILTFHWATNYGAILQAYCLQEYLIEQGHSVEIINYKPSEYDYTFFRIARHPSLWKHVSRELNHQKKEALLECFRRKWLHTTKRYNSVKDLEMVINNYDVIISGSDQVLSPSFTLQGENGGVTPVYWLGFGGDKLKRIGYAVSFGCEVYPERAIQYVKEFVNGFSAIGTRESTGLQILDKLSYKNYKTVVPDPTILYGAKLFKNIGVQIPDKREDYTCLYMLRHNVGVVGNVRFIDEKHSSLSMEQWLKTIVSAKNLITNSYHGMIMALMAHVPFAVVLESGSGSGMNDRFFTLLDHLNCSDRVASTIDEAWRILEKPLDYKSIDDAMLDYREMGNRFLGNYIGN